MAKKLSRLDWDAERIATFLEIPVVDVEIWLNEK